MRSVVFWSYGILSAEFENFFIKIKEIGPDIKRIHCKCNREQALHLAALISDSEDFYFIEFNSCQRLLNLEKFQEERGYFHLLENKKAVLAKTHSSSPLPLISSRSLDVIYLTYNEVQAEENFQKLALRYPHLKRLHGVVGLSRAFRLSAFLANTEHYILIDGDNLILEAFNLEKIVPPKTVDTVVFYMAQNPINQLSYGYGGVKICPRRNFLNIQEDKIDPIASGGIQNISYINEIASITCFNTSPFNAWKAGFREGVMLKAIDPALRIKKEEAQKKLDIWKNVGHDELFGRWTMCGARQGEIYALEFCQKFDDFLKINDPFWLQATFNTTFGDDLLDEASLDERPLLLAETDKKESSHEN